MMFTKKLRVATTEKPQIKTVNNVAPTTTYNNSQKTTKELLPPTQQTIFNTMKCDFWHIKIENLFVVPFNEQQKKKIFFFAKKSCINKIYNITTANNNK